MTHAVKTKRAGVALGAKRTRSLLLAIYRACRRAGSAVGLGKLSLARVLDTVVVSRLGRGPIRVRGQWMLLDRGDVLELASHGVYEPAETRFIEGRLRPGSVVVDVGANIGYHTLVLARVVGPSGRVFAFEPDPENFELLRKNVEMNGYRNTYLFRAAVSDRGGSTALFLSSNTADHRTYQPPNQPRESVAVEACRLDDRLADLAALDFVKLDIQGFEWRALEGMRSLLERSAGCCLMIEFWPRGLVDAGCEPSRFLDRLAELGFELNHVVATGQLRPVEASELLRRYTAENSRFVNLVCEKSGRADTVRDSIRIARS